MVKEREENLESKEERFLYWRVLIGSTTLVAGVLTGILIVMGGGSLDKIGIFGVVILFTVLIGSNILSGSFNLSKAEVRRAISISIVSVFFILLGKADKISTDRISIEETLLSSMIKNFWWIIVTVIVFYFGSRTLELFKKR